MVLGIGVIAAHALREVKAASGAPCRRNAQAA